MNNPPNEPQYGEGHVAPHKPSYWAVLFRDDGKLVMSRTTGIKVIDPKSALLDTFGIADFTDRFTFFILGSSLTEARKAIKKLPQT